jgi:phosphoribosyl-AMP cyclohydrolase
MHVQKIYTDCDTDTLLLLCKPDGPACHTGAVSCFYTEVEEVE